MAKQLSALLNLWKANPETSEAYQAGYEDRKKEEEHNNKLGEVAINQLRQLGYEVGEPINIIRAAEQIRTHCHQHPECSSCPFLSKNGCVLSGETPDDWKMGR